MGPGCSVEIPSECRGPSQEATWCPAVSTKASCSAVATKLLQRVALAESDPERGHFLIPDCFRDLQGLPVSGDSVLLLLAVFLLFQMLRQRPLTQVEASVPWPGAPASLRDAELGAGPPILWEPCCQHRLEA